LKTNINNIMLLHQIHNSFFFVVVRVWTPNLTYVMHCSYQLRAKLKSIYAWYELMKYKLTVKKPPQNVQQGAWNAQTKSSLIKLCNTHQRLEKKLIWSCEHTSNDLYNTYQRLKKKLILWSSEHTSNGHR
jgi:hypothetical protein